MINEEILLEARKITASFIKNRRIELGYSQQQVADFIGVKQQSYARMESGKFYLTTSQLWSICIALDLYFFLEEKESNSEVANLLKYRFTGGIPPSAN